MIQQLSIIDRLLFTLDELFLGSERTVSYADGVVLPKPEDNRQFDECCYCYEVYASLSTSDIYKNDYNGFYFQKQTSTDLCTFVLVEEDGTEHNITDDTYGTFRDFGTIDSNSNLTTFILSWKKVLTLLGRGVYYVRKDITIADVVIEEPTMKFQLEEFSFEDVDGTIRLDCLQDGTLRHLNTNFKGSDFVDSLRIRGYFGNKIPTYEQDNIVFANDVSKQISLKQSNEYILESEEIVPYEISDRLYQFILMGNSLWANDYNSDNHSYKYVRKEVELIENDSLNYYRNNRNVKFSVKFADRLKNIRKDNC